MDLEERNLAKPAVEKYFKVNIFPDPTARGNLMRSDKVPMASKLVPNSHPSLKSSTPVPDVLYGYNREDAFSSSQQLQLQSMGDDMYVNSESLAYPFFVVEFKADGTFLLSASYLCY